MGGLFNWCKILTYQYYCHKHHDKIDKNMQIKQKIKALLLKLKSLPIKYTAPSAVAIIGAILYSAFFFIEKPVTFSYARETCVNRLTLLPGIQRSSTDSGYEVKLNRDVQIGSWRVASRSVCITPVNAPQPGETKVTLSPYGSLFAKQTFLVEVGSPMVADAKVLDKPIPVSRPLAMRLVEVTWSFHMY